VVPDGTSIDLWARTADSPPGWTNWTSIKSGSRPSVQGRNFQWKAVLSSPGRHRSPTLYDLTVRFTTNVVPSARTEGDLSAYRKETVPLNASASDADGDPLVFFWRQTAGPPIDIQNPGEINTSFAAEAVGQYSFSFIAADPFGESAPALVNVTILNHHPVAIAPVQLTAYRYHVVLLNGSGRDPDADELSFCWTQLSGPSVQLSNPSSPVASFIPAALGEYMFSLVANDSYDASNIARVTVMVKNRVPVADAGKDILAHRSESILLFGSGSDGDDDPLTFVWSALEGPAVVLLNPDTPQATFTPTKLGRFMFQLVVRDGYDPSMPSFMNVTVVNLPPRAEAGPNSTVDVNETVQLQGGGEDGDGDSLTYQWTQTAGKPISLSNSNKRVATFVPQYTGTYSFKLTVNDTHDESCDTINITVVDQNNPFRFTSRPPVKARPGQLYRYLATYAGSGGDGACKLTLVSRPAGMVLSAAGTLIWTPRSDQLGWFNVSLALTDGTSTVHQNWTILVSSEPDEPAEGFWSSTSVAVIAVLAAVAAVACIAVLMVRRRRRPPARSQAPAPLAEQKGND